MNFLNKIKDPVKKYIVLVLNFLFGLVRRKPGRALVIFIFLLALVLRLIYLSQIPDLLSKEELDLVNTSRSITSPSDLWLGVNFKEGIYLYLLTFIDKFFGDDLAVYRSVSAIIGSLTVLLTFIFAKEWFNRRTGYFASFLLAVSSWHIALSRNIDSDVLFPFIVLSILLLANHAYRTKKNLYFVLSGIVSGLGLYVSPFFLFVPILFLVTGTYFYLRNNKFITAYIKEITYAANAFVVISIPYFIAFLKYPSEFLSQFSLKSFTNSLYNFGLILKSLFSKGEVNFLNNLGAEPLLDPFVAVLFLFGFLYMLINIKRRKNFFFIIMFVVFMLPGIFSKNTVVDKIGGLLPVIAIICGFSLNYIASHWFKTFPFNKSARAFLKGSFIFFFLITGFYHIQKYFFYWNNSYGVKEVYIYELPCSCKDNQNEIK